MSEEADHHGLGGPSSGGAGYAQLLHEAAQVVDALNEAVALEGDAHHKATHLLNRLSEMLGGDPDLQLLLYNETSISPAPSVIERVMVGPTFTRIEPRALCEVQDLVDECQPILRVVIPDALSNPRTPATLNIGRDIPDQAWFARCREKFLIRHGWVDFVLGTWAASKDRLVMLVLAQRADQPAWGVEAENLVSLMLRAVAPIVDAEMFDSLDSDPTDPTDPTAGPSAPALLSGRTLSARQEDVLHLLLRGLSEKEVARELGVSTHTVHTHVKRLYGEFDVSSRGELLALFVDRRVLKLLSRLQIERVSP